MQPHLSHVLNAEWDCRLVRTAIVHPILRDGNDMANILCLLLDVYLCHWFNLACLAVSGAGGADLEPQYSLTSAAAVAACDPITASASSLNNAISGQTGRWGRQLRVGPYAVRKIGPVQPGLSDITTASMVRLNKIR